MADVIIFDGTAGSGKTTIAKMLSQDLKTPIMDLGWLRNFHLDPKWKNANEIEEEMTCENILFLVKNYIKHGYKNIIILDFPFGRTEKIVKSLSRKNYILITLYLTDDAELKKRVLTETRDSRFRNFENAIIRNRKIMSRKLMKNEYRIDNTSHDPKKVVEKIKRIIKKK